jgi:hypothetical protein
MEDGSVMVLNDNGTWSYMTAPQGGASGDKGQVSSLHSEGSALRAKVTDAQNAAMQTALEALAKQMRKAMPGLEADDKVLVKCLDNEDKSTNWSEKRVGKSYESKVKLGMDEKGIQNVLECIKNPPQDSGESPKQ